MSEYEEILKRRDAEVRDVQAKYRRMLEALQRDCPHRSLTDWLLGDSGEARYCKRCNKAVEQRVCQRPPRRRWPMTGVTTEVSI